MIAKYPEEIKNFIAANAKGLPNADLTELINNTFKTNYTRTQIKRYKSNHHISSGLTGYYEKGHVPDNKGKKMSKEAYEKCSKTMFKKGNKPHNYKLIGFERLTKDGYIEVKVADPDKWKLKHRLVWEKEKGPIPKNSIVVFLNQDKTDIRIENLALISRSELLKMNQKQRFFKNSELTENGVLITKLEQTISKKLNKKYPVPNRKIEQAGKLKEQGLSSKEIMQVMNIKRSTLQCYLKLYKQKEN